MISIDEAIKYEKDGSLDGTIPGGNIFKYREQIAEWLEELKFIRRWKDDVMESFCKFDANSCEEVYQYGINKGRNDAVEEWCRWYFDMTTDAQINSVDNLIKRFNKEQLRIISEPKIVLPINEEEYKRDCRNCYQQGRKDSLDEFLTLAKNGLSLEDIERVLKENKNV